MRRWAVIVPWLVGCAPSPEPGDWTLDGAPEASTCAVWPDLPTGLDVLEADDGFVIALPSGSPTAACRQDGADFACEPLVFEWRFSDGTVESFVAESLTFTGRLSGSDEASGTARMALECQDEDCPNPGPCAATFGFTASYDAWIDLF